MPTPQNLKAKFYFNASYHLVFKCIDGLTLFKEETDFDIFKIRLFTFLNNYFHFLSYSLLDNHTHFIVKVKSIKDIKDYLRTINEDDKTITMKAFLEHESEEENFNAMLERQFNSFMVSYARYVMNKYNRVGGLFQKPFKRIRIEDVAHLQHAIIYTNANAQHHKLTDDFKDHPQNSYMEFLNNDSSFISCNEVISIFGSKERFIKLHDSQVEYYYKNNWPSSKLE